MSKPITTVRELGRLKRGTTIECVTPSQKSCVWAPGDVVVADGPVKFGDGKVGFRYRFGKSHGCIWRMFGLSFKVVKETSMSKPLTYHDICHKLTLREKSTLLEANMIPGGETSFDSTDHYITKIVEGKRVQLFTDESSLNEQQLRTLMRSLSQVTIRGGTTVAPGAYAGLVIEWTR